MQVDAAKTFSKEKIFNLSTSMYANKLFFNLK